MGNLLFFNVLAANIHDTKSDYFATLSALVKYPKIAKICGDSGYRGMYVEEAEDFLDIKVDIVLREKGQRWTVLPKRWDVERTFAWLGNSRWINKDYEIAASSSESGVMISHS